MSRETQSLFEPDRQWLQSFRRKVNAWFKRRQRDLPWRHTRDLYAIWVSEIMLQQTQVATVIPYYERFLKRFPTAVDLAGADESEVLRHWEGLGYYRRARQLHAAAKWIASEFGGEFPQDFAAVLALPGVGRYTAGAILSIGLDQRQPIVEANTVRLYSRLLLLRDDPTKSTSQRALWRFAESLLPPRRGAGQLNQALMELGSVVCTPQSPDCEHCPVADLCPANRHGLQAEIPVAKKRMKYEDVREAAVVVIRDGQVLLRQCGEGERWAGLWDFVRFDTPVDQQRAQRDAVTQPPTSQQLLAGTRRLLGLEIAKPRPLATLKHGVTRFRITLHVYAADLASDGLSQRTGLKWVRRESLEEVPLSVTGRKISRLLRDCEW